MHVALIEVVERWAHFCKKKLGIKSISSRSFYTVKGDVWLDSIVFDVCGMVHKNDMPFIEGSADDFNIFIGTERLVISGRATLCQEVSLWAVFDIFYYTLALSVRISCFRRCVL